VTGHAFISYSREDSAYVQRLVAYLEARGVRVWRDDRVGYVERWARVIQAQVDSCAVFVLVMTPASAISEWVERETARAEQQRRPIAPMLLAGQPHFRVSNIQFVDVTGGRMPADRFVESLRRLTADPGPAFAAPGPVASATSTPPLGVPAAGVSAAWAPAVVPAPRPGIERRWPRAFLVVFGVVLVLVWGGAWVFPNFFASLARGELPGGITALDDQTTTERLVNQVSTKYGALGSRDTLTGTVTSVRTNDTETYVSLSVSNGNSTFDFFDWAACSLLVPGSNRARANADPSRPWVSDIPPSGEIDGRLVFLEPIGAGITTVTLSCDSNDFSGHLPVDLSIPVT
jgi:hypothetical protein